MMQEKTVSAGPLELKMSRMAVDEVDLCSGSPREPIRLCPAVPVSAMSPLLRESAHDSDSAEICKIIIYLFIIYCD